MNVELPMVTAQPDRWEGGSLPSPKMCPAPMLPRRCDYWLDEDASVEVKQAPVRRNHFALRQACLLVWIIALSLLGYYLISHYVVTLVEVQGRSMAPTLLDGDRYFLNRLAYYLRPPARGDLVVVKDPGHNDCAVKRIVGLPGDSLSFQEGAVYLNGRKLPEPYLQRGMKTFTPDFKPKSLVLPAESYFLLGDNRANSEDSRIYGPIRRSQIVGLISK